jgi:DNA-binding MarR family transcriptional regulator
MTDGEPLDSPHGTAQVCARNNTEADVVSFNDGVLNLVQGGTDITMRQMGVAILLSARRAEPEARQVKVLARDLRLSRPAVTRGLDGLAREGYAKRGKLPGDKRSCIATLTAKGERFLAGLVGG